jgi:class 3 adenylate cyclase
MGPTIADKTASGAPAGAGAHDVPAAARLTSHRILEKLDRDHRGLEIVHKDLFDADARVMMSALSAVSTMGDKRSLKLVLRLATNDDETIRTTATEALGRMGHPEAAKVLFDLFKLTRSESVRKASLEALVGLAPDSEQVRALLRQQAGSHLVPAALRAAAAALLVRLEGEKATADLLLQAPERVVDAIYEAAEAAPAARPPVVAHGIRTWAQLSAENRIRVLRMATPFSTEGSLAILARALDDAAQEVREAAYRVIGTAGQEPHVAAIAAFLIERVDPNPVLEDEALAAIERLESLAGPGGIPDGRDRLLSQIQEMYRGINTTDRQVASESHELGWMIARSREYLEYYADENLRQGVVGFLKGSSNYTSESLLDALKRSAVRVEVRHFDGYTALADLFKNLRRSGLGLIARELAIARLGKRAALYRLIRCIRVTRLHRLGGLKTDPAALFESIFAWARDARIFRLAEAALYAIGRLDKGRTTALGIECLKPPIGSKICAIAAIRLIKDLDWDPMEPAVLRLLTASGDPYVLLNLLDALANNQAFATEAVVKAAVGLFRLGASQEVLQRVAVFLAHQGSPDLQEGLAACWDAAASAPWKQGLILDVFERWVVEGRVPSRESLVELLYRVLRGAAVGPARARIAALLWRMGDDYAPKLLSEIARGDGGEQLQVIRSLRGAVTPALAPLLRVLLPQDRSDLQEALADTMLSATDDATRDRMRDLVLALRGGQGGEADGDDGDVELRVDLQQEKKSFRFEKEHLQELAVFFSDIQGYSKKAQALSSMELTALIQEYEGILLPTILAHRGELIKKMGDGHLIVFERALDAVLAAVRVQKALKRFNGYREERSRVVIRIGVHWGKVVRRDGDVLGNHVNIASRLETSCGGGSVLVSDAVYQRLDGFIQARELAPIQVKNIAEPIKVFEPYEIALELPEDRDPLKAKPVEAAAAPAAARDSAPAAVAGAAAGVDAAAAALLTETFAVLNGLLQKAEKGAVPLLEVRRELGRRWARLKPLLGGRGRT